MNKLLVLIICLAVAVGLAMPLVTAGKGKPACNDRVDNDGDGLIDMDDPGCTHPGDRDEYNQPEIYCGDGTCNGNETCDTCEVDCGPCPVVCGDGVCEGNETQETCPEDCGYPDSCSDSDGGNVITVFGTTSGYLNGNPYSSDDYCADTSNVVEYYCVGDYEQSEQQNCGTDGYIGDSYCLNNSVYRDWRDYYCGSGECNYNDTAVLQETCEYDCTDGACVSPSDSCSDTDGGNEPYVQGTVSGFLSGQEYSYTDYCFINQTVNTTALMEYYCWSDMPFNYSLNCECVDGACV